MLVLSSIQRKVIDYLETHAGVIIAKDVLAKIIWGETWQDKYSDWAIDQFISTFRDKLPIVRKSAKLITKKGEGYIYIP